MVDDDYREDAQGRLVPLATIKPVDLLRDELVKTIVARGIEAAKAVAHWRAWASGEIRSFASVSAMDYGRPLGGQRGNITLTTFDGNLRVLLAVDDLITFDERLSVAKALIDECLSEWSRDSRPELRAVVLDAFQVDKRGRINTQRVLGLRRIEIEDPRWQEAMRAIADSVLITSSREYVRIYKRDPKGDYQLISMDGA